MIPRSKLTRATVAMVGAALCAACASAGTAPGSVDTSHPTPVPPGSATWTLVWQDEFDGPAGARVDSTKWGQETGGQGWGNQEREYYTKDTANASLDGAGHLVITARAEPANTTLQCWYGPCRYTSARLLTKGRFAQAYGRFEARIRIPRGQGLWPAFWMLGNDIDSVGWPQSGEIDIMENIGREPAVVHGTIHGPGYSGGAGPSRSYTLAQAAFADDFHVFAIEWEPSGIRWYVDDHLYHTESPETIPTGTRWVYDHPFFLLLNVAVGGGWPGDPDATTVFPQQMVVDYVRVYRR